MSQSDLFDDDDERMEENSTPISSSTGIQSLLSRLLSASSRDDGGTSYGIEGITRDDILRLLGQQVYLTSQDADEEDSQPSFRADADGDEEEEDEDDDEDYLPSFGRTNQSPYPPVTEPVEAGVKLLKSGEFGRARNQAKGSRNLSRLINSRFTGTLPSREDVCSDLIPNSNGTAVASCDANIYCGQFSADSSFYYTCAQDFRLHVFDMRKPPSPFRPGRNVRQADGLTTTLPIMRSIRAHPGRWTVTDANFSPDNQRMVYSSIVATAHVTSIVDENPVQIPLNFADRSGWGSNESFGIWSCRFSADGNEIVAGGDGKIFVYDLLANKRTVKIAAHDDDVNSCCWADTSSGNVLVSASDDTFLKVWDRRSLGASRKPSGVLVGHTEGITYVSAKGDGRYVISNGKDQALRLWDLRKMRTSQEYDRIKDRHYGVHNFDYRYPMSMRTRFKEHPQDCSVMTYRGHTVLRTLIRCHFSPAETTGSQYIYSGSYDGKVHIWSLDGRVVQVLDRAHTLPMSFDPSGPEPQQRRRHNVSQYPACVRDVSWHSREPVLFSAGWESGSQGSVVARHEWKGLSKLSSLEDWVEKAQEEHLEERRRSARLSGRRRRLTRLMPGSLLDDDDDDDDDYIDE